MFSSYTSCEGQRVFKLGRTTRFTKGVIRPVNIIVSIEQRNGKRRVIEETGIKGQMSHPSSTFNEDGDSGAWIFDEVNVLFSMMWDSCSKSRSCYFTLIEVML